MTHDFQAKKARAVYSAICIKHIGESTIMNMNETLTMAALMLAPGFFSLLGMGAFGSPVVALLGELTAKSKGRVFYDKYGQQTASMGLILLIMLVVIWGAAIGVALVKFPQAIQQFVAPESPMFTAFYGLGAFILFSLPYFLSWKKMRNSKGLHIVLGFGATIGAIACVAMAVPGKLALGLAMNKSEQADAAMTALAYPMATMYAILIVSAAAALSCSYLVMRRNKDDFGRDYYNFSLKLAARWAAIPMFGFLACQGWLFAVLPQAMKTMIMGTPLAIVWGVAAGLGLTCSILWIVIARSQTPLQIKGLSFLAVILFWLMHTLNATMFMNLMTMM